MVEDWLNQRHQYKAHFNLFLLGRNNFRRSLNYNNVILLENEPNEKSFSKGFRF